MVQDQWNYTHTAKWTRFDSAVAFMTVCMVIAGLTLGLLINHSEQHRGHTLPHVEHGL